jgi:hypothetical protein
MRKTIVVRYRTKRLFIIVAAMLFQSALCYCQSNQREFPVLNGPYLGQKPPGLKPEIFAAGIVSTGLNTRDIAISIDGNEIYFGVTDAGASAIFVTRKVNDRWLEPVIAPFSGKGFLDLEPHISPVGNKFFFLSNRPPHGQQPRKGWYYQNIWMMTKTASGWSDPQLVDEPVSTEDHEYFPSVTRANVLYFTRQKKDGPSRMYKAGYENCRYQEPEMVPLDIPEKGSLFNAFISPREDFLITCAINIDSSNVDSDYYISFKKPNDEWSQLIRFGPEINPPGDNASSAYVSPDGKYLFFSSLRKDPSKPEFGSGTSLRAMVNSKAEPGYGASAIYWVDAKIIEEMKPKGLH